MCFYFEGGFSFSFSRAAAKRLKQMFVVKSISYNQTFENQKHRYEKNVSTVIMWINVSRWPDTQIESVNQLINAFVVKENRLTDLCVWVLFSVL